MWIAGVCKLFICCAREHLQEFIPWCVGVSPLMRTYPKPQHEFYLSGVAQGCDKNIYKCTSYLLLAPFLFAFLNPNVISPVSWQAWQIRHLSQNLNPPRKNSNIKNFRRQRLKNPLYILSGAPVLVWKISCSKSYAIKMHLLSLFTST